MSKWFYNGTKMQDGTLISIKADNAVQENDYKSKGWVCVDDYNGQFGELKSQEINKEVLKVSDAKKSKDSKSKNVVKTSKASNVTKDSKDKSEGITKTK